MKKIYKYATVLAVSSAFVASIQAKTFKLESPNDDIKIEISDDTGSLTYDVFFKGKPVIKSSAMGLVINDTNIGEKVALSSNKKYKEKETYVWRGVHSEAKNYFNGLKVEVKNTNQNVTFVVDIRAFNDGVAFQYQIDNLGTSVISEDKTTYVLPNAGVAYWQGDIRNYEGRGVSNKVSEFKEGQPIGPPLTVKLPESLGYVAITEGGLVNTAGFSLVADGKSGFNSKVFGSATIKGRIESSWRVIMLSKDLNGLVNSDIVHNVAPSYDKALFPQGFNTPWVKPGRSVWTWLAGERVEFDTLKKFTDYAAELGFEYNLVDEGWEKWTNDGKDKWTLIKELVDYSRPKNVGIWIWKAYDRGDLGTDLKHNDDKLEFLKKCKEVGVVGVKVDFFDKESQEVITYCQELLREAAELGIMIDFHGMPKPTGESRTWPHEMTREGVRGLENGNDWAFHNTWLPFTRYLAGHGDYTPVSFRGVNGSNAVSWPHHIASAVTFTSPFLCYGAHPANIIKNPARDLIVSIPATWDETIVLPQSEIGEVSAMTRRNGDTWFLAVMNGHGERNVDIKLDFLSRGKYDAYIVKDDMSKGDTVVIENKTLTRSDTVNTQLRDGGGYVIRFTKAK